MTDWNHQQPYAPYVGPEEGQQAEGGRNRPNNCVPDAMSIVTRAYGGPDLEPQDIVNEAYGRTYLGYTDYEPILAVIRRHFPALPPVWTGNPVDTIGTMDQHAVQGHAVVASFWSDGNGVIKPWNTGILHVCVVQAHQAGRLFVRNSEDMSLPSFSESDFRQATSGAAGALAIFLAPLPSQAPAPSQPIPPTTLTGDIDMARQRIPVTISTDGNGNGWDSGFEGRNIAWSSMVGAPLLNGTDPDQAADKDYAHGTSPCAGSVRAQQRDGKVLIEVMGCRPNASEIVWVDVAS